MRTSLKIIQLLALVCLLPCVSISQARDQGFTQIAPGVYLRPGIQEEFSPKNRGHIANIGFIVGDQRVAVIDTGSSYREGMELRNRIAEVTALPIAYVIITHMHPDHALGAAAFSQDNPVFIGHEALADALVRRQTYLTRMQEILGSDQTKGTRIVLPTSEVAVDQVLELDLGGRSLQLRAYPTAHTNNDLSVYDTKTQTLWLSDLLFVGRIPVVDGSLLGWLKLIDDLGNQICMPMHTGQGAVTADLPENPPCARVRQIVPGHGPVVTQWQLALADERRYLEHLATGIRQIINRGGTITEAVAEVGGEERDKWPLFDQYHGRNVTAGFVELEWE